MSADEPYFLTPSDLADLAGIPETVQRDWRRRGILPNESVAGICKKSSNGRWSFTLGGYKFLWLINRLAKSGFDLYDATTLSGVLADDMNAFMRHNNSGTPVADTYCRYFFVSPSEEKSFRPKSNWLRTNEPVQGFQDAPNFSTMIDVERLAFEFARSLDGLAKHKVDEMRAWVLIADPSAKAIFDAVDEYSPFPEEANKDD